MTIRQSRASHFSVMLVAGGLLVSGLLAGCAATTAPEPTVVQRIEGTKPGLPANTAFLGSDYGLLKPGKEGQVALVYFNPNARWSGYSKVLLEPVQFWAAPNSSVPAADQKALTSYFYNVLKEDLGKSFTLVDEPGPGVMTVQVALNEASGAVPIPRSVSVLIPQARVLNYVQSLATGSYAFVGSAEAQAKIVDSVGGQLLAAGADRRLGGMQIAAAAQWQWGDAEKIMKYWAAKISTRLQELRTQGKLS
jgi:hypothetical protein